MELISLRASFLNGKVGWLWGHQRDLLIVRLHFEGSHLTEWLPNSRAYLKGFTLGYWHLHQLPYFFSSTSLTFQGRNHRLLAWWPMLGCQMLCKPIEEGGR